MKLRLIAGVLVGVLGWAVAAPALAVSADERQDGLWYANVMKLDEIHGQGITGEGVTIAVIDGGINTKAAELQGANITLKGRWCVDDEGNATPVDTTNPEISHHGTSVVATIVGNGVAGDGGLGARGIAPDAEIWFYGGASPHDAEGWSCSVPHAPEGVEVEEELLLPAWQLRYVEELRAEAESEEELTWYSRFVEDDDWDASSMAALDAIRSGADIINVSGTSTGDTSWAAVMAEAIREGVVVVGAIPNADQGFGGDFEGVEGGLGSKFGSAIPAELNGVVAVNAFDQDASDAGAFGMGNLAFGAPGVDLLLPGWSFDEPELWSGTSFATPLVTGTIALGLQKYPDATGHQVLQAMIRTTGSVGFAEPHWEDTRLGYGLVNPKAMLEVDIPQMPEENPLFVTDPNDPRCADWDGVQPSSVSECTAWAHWPEPADVWPDKFPLELDAGDANGPEPSEEPTGKDDPTGSNASPAGGGGGIGWMLGVGIVLLLAAGGVGVFVMKRK